MTLFGIAAAEVVREALLAYPCWRPWLAGTGRLGCLHAACWLALSGRRGAAGAAILAKLLSPSLAIANIALAARTGGMGHVVIGGFLAALTALVLMLATLGV